MIVMQYLHTMVRVSDLDASLKFYCDALGLEELRRYDNDQGRFTLVFLSAPGNESSQVELTYNWDRESYSGGRNFGRNDVVINRPPRDGRMAFVRSPDGISVELLQAGEALAPAEPWLSMENIGEW